MPQRTRSTPVNPAVRALGKNVRVARLAANMTQEALAHEAGMQPPEVSKIERGLQDPRVSTVVRLAQALGTSPGRLLDGI